MTPLRVAALAGAVLFGLPTANACTFCDGSARTQQTLRVQYSQAKVVLIGQLKNARFDPVTDNGTTEFHVTTALKDEPARRGAVLTLPRYQPTAGDAPADHLLFCTVAGGRLEPGTLVSAPPVVVGYVRAVAALDERDPVNRVTFFYGQLDSPDPTVAADAFFEVARTADGDILKAAGRFDAAKVRKLIADPNTPVERLGVFAFVLGVCGSPADGAFLGGLLKADPPSDRVSGAFGGLLAGYILLDPKDGWALAAAVLGDVKRGYATRLSALGTVRFFQATRPGESRANVLACCAALLPHGDLADQAVEDLRRWNYWELTPAVLSQFTKPTHAAPIVRRSIVRYALSCPTDETKAFVAATRRADPKLVRDVEEMLARFAPVGPRK